MFSFQWLYPLQENLCIMTNEMKEKNYNTEFLKIKNMEYEFKNRLEKQKKRQISGKMFSIIVLLCGEEANMQEKKA